MEESVYLLQLQQNWEKVEEPVWLGLRAMLGTRSGWHFSTRQGGVAAWCFGRDGGVRIAVYPHRYLVTVCIPEEYVQHTISLEDLEEVLEPYESRLLGYTDLQIELGAQILRRELEEDPRLFLDPPPSTP